jgi:cytochrome P450
MNLCKYPEYLAPLREEIARLEHEPETEAKYNSMVLMDSFLKETGRLQPLLSCKFCLLGRPIRLLPSAVLSSLISPLEFFGHYGPSCLPIRKLVTMARKALKPFTFADGTHVPKDNWICAPQQVINLNETNYSSPSTFDPFRFVPSPTASAEEIHASRFTTPSYNYLYWSGPKRPW